MAFLNPFLRQVSGRLFSPSSSFCLLSRAFVLTPPNTTALRSTLQQHRPFTYTTPVTMRLDYIPADPQMSSAEDQDIVDRVKARRGGSLLALDRALLHAPQLADGWNGFLGAVRTKTTLPASVREVAICRVAVLNQAWYEWHAHAPILEKTGELSAEAVQYIKDRARPESGRQQASDSEGSKLLDEKHLAVLEYADAMTVGCVVPEPVFKKVKGLFNEREVVELTGTVAAYNCVSRFLVALDIGEMAEKYKVDMS